MNCAYLWWRKCLISLIYHSALKSVLECTYRHVKKIFFLHTYYLRLLWLCVQLHSSLLSLVWFQSLVQTQGLPLSVFGLSPQSILHPTSFGWTHKITVSSGPRPGKPGTGNAQMCFIAIETHINSWPLSFSVWENTNSFAAFLTRYLEYLSLPIWNQRFQH